MPTAGTPLALRGASSAGEAVGPAAGHACGAASGGRNLYAGWSLIGPRFTSMNESPGGADGGEGATVGGAAGAGAVLNTRFACSARTPTGGGPCRTHAEANAPVTSR